MNLGGAEILVVIVVALMIFGPDKLPGALRSFGKVMAEIRKYQDMAKSEIDKAVNQATSTDTPSKEKSEPERPIDAIVDNEKKSAPKEKTVPDDSDVVPPILDEDDQ
jgi:Tat protein translocase TatB subunit